MCSDRMNVCSIRVISNRWLNMYVDTGGIKCPAKIRYIDGHKLHTIIKWRIHILTSQYMYSPFYFHTGYLLSANFKKLLIEFCIKVVMDI